MKILHISDLHFPHKLSLLSLRGKSVIGYLNYRLRRRSKHPITLFENLIHTIKNLEYDVLVISGDITNVSHPSEFENARELLDPILDDRVFLIPGNHDRYQKRALYPEPLFEQTFGKWIGDSLGQFSYLKSFVKKKYRFIGWDSNLVHSLPKASGHVPMEVVEQTVKQIQEPYILVCHHPIWNPNTQMESAGHRMSNRIEVAKKLLSNPPVLYLHGHTHTNWVKLPGKDLPFAVVNSASSTRLSDKKHECGFHLIEIGQTTLFRRFLYIEGRFVESQPIFYEESEGVV